MKTFYFCLLMAALYAAPHTNGTLATIISFGWLLAAVLNLFKND